MQTLLLLFVAVICGLAVWLVGPRVTGSSRRPTAMAVAVFGVVWGISWLFQTAFTDPVPQSAPSKSPTVSSDLPPPDLRMAQLAGSRPIESSVDGYVSSHVCKECHAGNHASWSGSYHRTMTQVASADTVLGDFEDVKMSVSGHDYHMRRRNDVCWVTLDNPDEPPPRIDAPVVMTTGSHHMQVYWYATGHSRLLGQFPLVYLKEAKRWIPRDAAFLVEPNVGYSSETGRWNETCIGCHATHGRMRPTADNGWDTQVAEFGISCEACHGPGERHVAARRADQRAVPREGEAGPIAPNGPIGPRLSESPKDKSLAAAEIVNPIHLSHQRSSQVCGQCHSVSSALDPDDFRRVMDRGYRYRPGEDLDDSRVVVQASEAGRQHLAKYVDNPDDYLKDRFWPDGMIRIAGREYNGLLESKCFQQGELSCLSCHVLHKPDEDPRSIQQWADDQLKDAGAHGPDHACIQCHASTDYGAAHTHHSSESTGSRCYNCHMPHTTYGLLKAIRSHTITIPDVGRDREAGRPNACNLCHLDKTLVWSAERLNEWNGRDQPPLDEEERRVAASLLWLLKGDAGQRSLAAWSMGWAPAQAASGTDWQPPLLASLLEDPYHAVRYIAARSLRSLPGFEQIDYDFLGSSQQKQATREFVVQQWKERQAEKDAPALDNPSLLIEQNQLQAERLRQLLKQRNDRPINLVE